MNIILIRPLQLTHANNLIALWPAVLGAAQLQRNVPTRVQLYHTVFVLFKLSIYAVI